MIIFEKILSYLCVVFFIGFFIYCIYSDYKEDSVDKEFIKKYKKELENRYFKFEYRYYLVRIDDNLENVYYFCKFSNYLEDILREFYKIKDEFKCKYCICIYGGNCLRILIDNFNTNGFIKSIKDHEYSDTIYTFDKDIEEYVKQL